jgi:hypothetical protein
MGYDKRLNEVYEHMLLRCKSARAVKLKLHMNELRLELIECPSPKEVINSIMQQDMKTKLKCIALCWSWWKARSKTNES